MKERLIEFKQELNVTDLNEMANLKAWFSSWVTYIKKGGVRPGHPH